MARVGMHVNVFVIVVLLVGILFGCLIRNKLFH